MELVSKVGRELGYLRNLGRLLGRVRHIRPYGTDLVPDLVERWARETPGKVAIVMDERQVTYREYDETANRYANHLRALGVRRGEVVALLMDNRPEYLFAWLGIVKIGAIAALINTNLTGHALAHTLKVAGASHLVLDAEHGEAWQSARPHLPEPPQAWATGGPLADAHDLDAELARASTRFSPGVRAGMRSKDRCLYIYTSGTTGLPKAANISHLRFLTIAHAFGGCLRSTAEDRVYVALPLYHTNGGVGGVGAAITVGGTVVIRAKFSAREFFPDLVRHRCTKFVYIGELCRYLLQTQEHPDEKRHQVKVCMGNGLRPEVWIPFQERFRIPEIVEFYGSSEGNVAFFNLDGKVGSIGRLPTYMAKVLPMRLVKYDVERDEVVRGPGGRCIECAPGEVGEAIGMIHEKLPGGRFEGYTSKEATEKKVLRDVFRPGDRFFRTGDLLKKDADGYYYFVDRIGDTFRWKGENVATSEVAEILSTCPGVKEANVYGVRVPGTDGRAGMAALVVDDGAFDIGHLYERSGRDLAPYARPLFVRIQQEMQVTGTFKHRKVDLVEEGFDPGRINEPLYFRDDAAGCYVQIDPVLHDRIAKGEVRF